MTSGGKRSLSIVLSFRNEEEVLEIFIEQVHAALQPAGIEYELIFVDDHSSDRSREILAACADSDPRIRTVVMSNRFGVVPCMFAGMEQARGDAIVIMDCDLQDPPALLPELIAKWRGGADVVYTTRTVRHGEPAFKLWLTKWAYRVVGAFSETDIPVDSGMFKLLDRRVVDTLLTVGEQDPYLRGLITWVGFRQEQVTYERAPRQAGTTHFPLFSQNPVREFIVALVSFSKLPLIAIFALSAIALTVGVFVFFAALLGSGWIAAGFAAVFMLFGLQFLAIGILGLYIGRIYRQTRGRPHYIVGETAGQGLPNREDA